MFKLGRFSILLLATACVVEEPAEEVAVETQEIVGGTAAQISEYPWQVSLQSAQGAHFCGGSIVTPTWIMTAAHCMGGGNPGRIVAGVDRLSQSASGQIRTVKRVVLYPGYADPTQGKDAALIELTTPLTLDGTKTKAIRPLTAASPASLTAPGVMTKVSGWGATVEGGQTLPDQLQAVQLPVIAMATANQAYGMTLTDDQLAAGVTAGGKDSCQGDSGGPLIVYDGAEPVLAGIVSWGEGCARANIPGMYARMSSFASWADGYAGGPPVASAGNDLTVAPSATVNLDGTASKDTGFGTIAAYEWKQVSGTPVTINNATSNQASFTAPSSTGTIELELTVRDGGGATASDRVTVQISRNGGGEPGGGGGGGGDDENADVVGGCSSSNGGTGLGFLFLLGLFLVRRRK